MLSSVSKHSAQCSLDVLAICTHSAGWHDKGPMETFISLEFDIIQTWASLQSFVMSATAASRGICGMCWLGQAGTSHKLKDANAQKAESLLMQPTALFFWLKESLPGVHGQERQAPTAHWTPSCRHCNSAVSPSLNSALHTMQGAQLC